MNAFRLVVALSLIVASLASHAAVRVYDVDPAYRQEVINILNEMLSVDNPTLSGRVQLLPTGQIAVDTTMEARQEEIAALLAEIAAGEPEPTPIYTLRYWLLQGTSGGSDSALPDALADVAEELESMHGELSFRVLDSATITGRAGGNSFIGTDTMELMQRAVVMVSGNQLNANIFLETDWQELSVDVSITRGEYVVLNSSTSSEGVVALVVNWPEEN